MWKGHALKHRLLQFSVDCSNKGRSGLGLFGGLGYQRLSAAFLYVQTSQDRTFAILSDHANVTWPVILLMSLGHQ